MNTTDSTLTKYKGGSFGELFSICLPLMLTAVSGSLMYFLDRVILARYSVDAMNAAVSGWMAFAVLQFAVYAVASITEVFVGQYNGAKRYRDLGAPVWQMLYFSLMSGIVFIPFAFVAGPWVIPSHYESLGVPYFKWTMLLGMFFPMIGALSGFFVAQGKTKMVLLIAVVSNVLNIVLDYLLVFGVEGFVPFMGTKGAAVATGISQLLAVSAYLILFLKPLHRREHGTGDAHFRPSLFMRCLKVGVPAAIGHGLEILPWTLLLGLVASQGNIHMTVFVVCQSVFVLFVFVSEGLQKGVTAIVSNYVGKKELGMIPGVLRSGVKLCLLMAGIIFIPFWFYPDVIVHTFLSEELGAYGFAELEGIFRISLMGVWAALAFDFFVWLLVGVIIGAGDTKFFMWMSSMSGWLFSMLPVWIGYHFFQAGPTYAPLIFWFSTSGTALCYYVRYRTGCWKGKALISSCC